MPQNPDSPEKPAGALARRMPKEEGTAVDGRAGDGCNARQGWANRPRFRSRIRFATWIPETRPILLLRWRYGWGLSCVPVPAPAPAPQLDRGRNLAPYRMRGARQARIPRHDLRWVPHPRPPSRPSAALRIALLCDGRVCRAVADRRDSGRCPGRRIPRPHQAPVPWRQAHVPQRRVAGARGCLPCSMNARTRRTCPARVVGTLTACSDPVRAVPTARAGPSLAYRDGIRAGRRQTGRPSGRGRAGARVCAGMPDPPVQAARIEGAPPDPAGGGPGAIRPGTCWRPAGHAAVVPAAGSSGPDLSGPCRCCRGPP